MEIFIFCSDYKEACFYLTYCTVFKGVKLVLENPGGIHASYFENKKAFLSILIIIFKKDASIREHLIRSKLPNVDKKSSPKPCEKMIHLCQLCHNMRIQILL